MENICFRKKFSIIMIFTLLTMIMLSACGQSAGKVDSGSSELVEIEGDLSNVEATTMTGRSFSSEDFQDYDLTVINIWSTTCSYCIEEMEGLEKFYNQLPEGVNFITICMDAGFDMDLAQTILDKKGATFDTLIGNSSLNDALLQNVMGTPTTVFVDKDGRIVGSSMVGAPCTEDMDRSASLYLNVTKDHLKDVK